MPALSLKKKKPILVLLLLLAGVLALLTHQTASDGSAVAEHVDQPEAAEVGIPRNETAESSSAAATVADETAAAEAAAAAHALTCAHRAAGQPHAASAKDDSVSPVLHTQPQFDAIFKKIDQQRITYSRSDFDFLKGSQVGQPASFQVAGQEFSGEVVLVREGERAQSYMVDFPGGQLIVTVDRLGEFKAHLMLQGDSRVVEIAELKNRGGDMPAEVLTPKVSGKTHANGDLVASEASVSDVLCTPPGAVYPLNAPQPVPLSNFLETGVKDFPQPVGPVQAPILTAKTGSGHVLYLNFDGAVVTGDAWNRNSDVSIINALPAPRANDTAWVTAVWKRVVEDMAPFDITVTTDRALFDATPSDKRLQAIITPTNVVAPGAGGVAFLNSYATDFTDIVWVFNLTEYSAATTITHEAGHAFALSHDGDDVNEYYPGHNDSYTPGWAAIMGAAFRGLHDEVDQWSKGEYANANNQEDDIAIIANAANGFGFKPDDYADVFIEGGALNVGALVDAGPNMVAGSGIISTSTDKDVFRFSAAFSGAITMTVSPLDVQSTDSAAGSKTKGANLAVATRLLDAAGQEIAVGTDVGDVLLTSLVSASVEPGIYYLEVTGAGRGDNPSTGFSDYASLGQYTIAGELPTQPLNVSGSQPSYAANGAYLGPGKLNQAVLLGDTSTRIGNGTDYGFSFPANGPVRHTFMLKNNATTDLTNVVVSLTTAVDFGIVSAPPATIPPGASVLMSIKYDPLQTGIKGVDDDIVTINYDTPDNSITFDYAISGVSTPSATKDNYEVNDVFNQATDLNAVKDTWLSDYKGRAFFLSYNDDFYTINAPNGELITVDVAYDASEGPINFALYNSQNQILGTTTAENGRMLFLVPEDYPAPNKPFYIRATIDPDPTARKPYDLRWSSRAASGDDDFYEGENGNNTRDEAFDLTGGFSPRLSEYLGYGILKNEDWYKLEIPRDPFLRIFYVRAEFINAEGNIDIEIFAENEGINPAYEYGLTGQDEDYEVLTYFQNVGIASFAEKFTPDGNTNIMGLEPGIYYVRVTGDYAGNEYDLVVEAKRDDNYEIIDAATGRENDTLENATDLGEAIFGQWLSAIDGIGVSAAYNSGSTPENFASVLDPDWYRFTLPEGTNTRQLLIDYDSIIAETREFRIYNARGEFLANNLTTNGATTAVESSGVISVPNPEGSTFFIAVTPNPAMDGLSPYDFRVTLSPEPPINEFQPEDNYEENDNYQQAFDLRDHAGFWLTAKDGYGVQKDMDFYLIHVPQGAKQLTVTSTFDGGLGELNLNLYNAATEQIFTGTDPNAQPKDPDAEVDPDAEPVIVNAKAITVENPAAGQYYIYITGDNRGNRYNLFWDFTPAEDAYEQNDTRPQAFDLLGHEKQLLSKLNGKGIQADEDWYRIAATANTAELKVLSTFMHEAGDIDVELYNAAGFLIARSVSVTNNEAITLPKPAAGDYFVRVYYGNAGNSYDLWWGAFSQPEIDDLVADAYEIDNSKEQATVLPQHTSLRDLEGLATQTDSDWWSIDVSAESLGFLVECSFTHADGDIDIEVIDPLGAVVMRANSQTDNEIINYNAPLPAGTYFVRVYGANLGNSYDLNWVDYRSDAFEENDSFGTAFDITDLRQRRLSATGVPTQGDEDWYRFTAAEANSILVTELTYTHAQGAIFFEVYDSNRVLLTADTSNDETKYLQFALPSTGEFFIRIFGDNAYNEYDLFWNAIPEDAFEDNDIRDEAYDISSEEGVPLKGAVFDDDWFVIDPSYGVVSVELTLDFVQDFGDIDINVYNQFGELVALAFDVTNGETVTFEVDPFDGKTYIEIFGYDGDYGNSYNMTWVSMTRDTHEDNDTLATATDLSDLEGIPLSESGGYDTSADEDWFMIKPTGTNLNVFCRFDHAAGNIDIELFNANGIPIERSISTTDDELITTTVTTGATYYIRVFGETAGNPYDLVWNSYDADDAYEDNDTLATATDLTGQEYILQKDLRQLDEDWYEVAVQAGDTLFVAEIYPVARVGRMVFELYDAGGTSDESVATADGGTRLEKTGLAAGTYYLRVSGRDIGGKYALAWSSGNEDNYEENDSAVDAVDLTVNVGTPLSAINGSGAQYDEDWFSVTLAADDGGLSATLDFVHNLGDLNLYLYDANEDIINSSFSNTDNESIVVNGLDAGVYYLQVIGNNLGNAYDLTLKAYADDNYEDNDSFGESYGLGNAPAGTLSPDDGPGVRGADDDYFALSIPTGYVTLDVTCSFLHADGDISLEVFDGQQASLASSDTLTDDESVSVSVNPNGGKIYILVSGGDETGANYDLTWTFGTEDLYEDNESATTATDITANPETLLSEFMGHGTQTDADFYLVTLPPNSLTLNVNVFFSHSLGDINVNVYDSVPGLIASANSTTDNEILAVPVSAAGGDYYIEVTGADDSGNYYDLIWSVDVDDPYEENDDITTPYDLSASDGVRLSAGLGLGMKYDEDWFSVTTPAGALALSVLVDEFSKVAGNIDLELYDAADNLVASSINGVNSEEIKVAVDPAGESFKIRVFGEDKGNAYDLLWTTSTLDIYEDNDFVEDFYDLSDQEGVWLSAGQGRAAQSDDDWYQIVVSSGATTLTIDCTFTHVDGDIDLELYRLDPTADGEKTDPDLDQRKPTRVDRVTSTDNNEQIIYDTTGAPGIYFIRVYFGNAGNVYDLRWDDALVDLAGDSVFLSEFWVFSKKENSALDARLLAPLANADADAFPNWAEYALDLDVDLADTVDIENSIQEIDGKRYFTISYVRNAEAVTAGYQFFVEESNNLIFDASNQAVQLHQLTENLGDGLERVTYRCSRDMAEISQCFFRIRVEPPAKGF